MFCKRCNNTGRISEEDDPFDAGTPAGDGQLICPQCNGKTELKTPCDCSLSLMLSQGCQNPNHIKRRNNGLPR